MNIIFSLSMLFKRSFILTFHSKSDVRIQINNCFSKFFVTYLFNILFLVLYCLVASSICSCCIFFYISFFVSYVFESLEFFFIVFFLISAFYNFLHLSFSLFGILGVHCLYFYCVYINNFCNFTAFFAVPIISFLFPVSYWNKWFSFQIYLFNL